MRTQIAIIGAGPAGMFLAHLLHAAGIDCMVLEARSRDYIEARVRAGVLEHTTVNLLEQLGLGARVHREGLLHTGTNLAIDGDLFRIDMADLTGGKTVMVYGQQEVMNDLFNAAAQRGIKLIFQAEAVEPHDVTTDRPHITWHDATGAHRLDCDFIAGCDGYHGVSRRKIPDKISKIFERAYPFGWLGILADVPPANHELIYANHERGFALASMRSATRSRYYVQCPADDRPEDWPDDRFWDEVCLRLGPEAAASVIRGPSFEKTIAPLRSFVTEPMQWGKLFLAGDAAHIVPPTGAKGMNLAVSDVIFLAEAIIQYYRNHATAGLDGYSERALARVWKAERFSWWFTTITHRFPDMDGFDRKMQVAELNYVKSSKAAQTVLSENYVGLPI